MFLFVQAHGMWPSVYVYNLIKKESYLIRSEFSLGPAGSEWLENGFGLE